MTKQKNHNIFKRRIVKLIFYKNLNQEVIKLKKRIFSLVLALCLCISSQSAAHAWQEEPSQQENVLAEESASALVTRDSTIPTPTEAYEAMIA